MIVMLDKEHLNQKNVVNQSVEVHLDGVKESEQGKVVTIKGVVTMLNNQQSIEQVAESLQMRVNVLTAKLANAAVRLNDEGKWVYVGENESDSLARNIYKKTYVKLYDRKYVSLNDELKDDESNVSEVDLDYELYKASLNVQSAVDKKSVLFEEGLYEELKKLSQMKKIKVSSLINVLIKKGLEHYRLK